MQFRYQMEERDGGFSYYCSQRCLEKSQRTGSDDGQITATCDACKTRFLPELVSQVFYVQGRRHYACGVECRAQLVREASGARLGDLGSKAAVRAAPPPTAAPSQGSAPPAAADPAAAGTPKVLAIFNHKGGTGKTTTAVSVAAGLAQKGRRVLMVDTDAQGNVSVSLGAKSERTLYHVLVMGLRVSDAVQSIRPGLDLLPSNETLAAAELYLAGRQNRDRVLCERLGHAVADYDYVILDCSPSLSLMNQNALVLADSVLVPVACDYLSLVGVRQVIKTVKNVNALLHHPVQIWGVLPTFFDARAKICHEAVAALRGHFGDRCLPPIRAAIKIKEAPSQGQTIFEYAAGTNAAEDYARIVDAIEDSRDRQGLPVDDGARHAPSPGPLAEAANVA
jgi:chromosome partitioning protein